MCVKEILQRISICYINQIYHYNEKYTEDNYAKKIQNNDIAIAMVEKLKVTPEPHYRLIIIPGQGRAHEKILPHIENWYIV